MKIVLVHRHGPGQFVHLACHLANAGWQVSFLCEAMNVQLPGIRTLRQPVTPPPPATPFAQYHQDVGLKAARTLESLVREEGAPDIVYGHIGWGSMMFARDVLPQTPLIGYCEHYYHASGRDVGFDPDDDVTLAKRTQLRLRNAAQLSTLDQLDAAISPTRWQKSAFPVAYHHKIGVCHEGVDTYRCRPNPNACLTLPNGKTLGPDNQVVTYVARDLEPYRGFPTFMRAAAKLAERCPDAEFVIAGGDGVSYGQPRSDSRTWRDAMMTETGINPKRIHFLGQIPHDQLIKLYQISSAHIYLTYPFVLSWSVLEAMSCRAPVIASNTGPCQDVIRDQQNGLMTDFWDSEALADKMHFCLTNQSRLDPMREQARATITANFDLKQCLEKQTNLLERLAANKPKARQVV
ncbi:glycosyltransferase [Thalassospira sp.]|uniref:glycosyltransferase n=1 Tax=Thalassospira sp. TaxID=1912094 RepID=UPI000C54FB81|nr:glycosyltransferase [Thalassospira sp.]MBC06133.1 glycosyl transferase [Thalassospira sp.]|tara:strand:+ start:21733 stop:22950 length:1218 start_codon:yes stop_codon:yes gene_type:complete